MTFQTLNISRKFQNICCCCFHIEKRIIRIPIYFYGYKWKKSFQKQKISRRLRRHISPEIRPGLYRKYIFSQFNRTPINCRGYCAQGCIECIFEERAVTHFPANSCFSITKFAQSGSGTLRVVLLFASCKTLDTVFFF